VIIENKTYSIAIHYRLASSPMDTDEDAFGSADAGQLLAIRVGSPRVSRAGYRLRCQDEIDQLLRAMVQLRRSSRPGAPLQQRA
jgi:hypothetical protein